MGDENRDSSRNECHVVVHAMPTAAPGENRSIILAGRAVAAFRLPAAALRKPLPVTFDDAADQLSRWPRMFLEADGSFVWRGERPDRWQIDGQLHDGRDRLQAVELRVRGAAAPVARILEVLGWPTHSLLAQCIEDGVFVEVGSWMAAICGGNPGSCGWETGGRPTE